MVLFEPSPGEIFRGGTPAPQSKSGNRLIFLNVPLLDFEQAALNKLHEALKNENTLAPGGTMPSYVRLHALRLLQQAKWKVEKALHTIATHLEMLESEEGGVIFSFFEFPPFSQFIVVFITHNHYPHSKGYSHWLLLGGQTLQQNVDASPL